MDGTMSAKAILNLRHSLNLTQVEFAERLGIHQGTVSKLETGTLEATGPILRLLLILKGISP